MNKDQVLGRVNEAKGKSKETAGKVTDDKKQQAKGSIEKNAGKGQAKAGDLKDKFKKH